MVEKLYRTYRDNTYRVCLAVTRDPALAEEAVQQCWKGVLRRAARHIGPKASPRHKPHKKPSAAQTVPERGRQIWLLFRS